jgi:hypothetical protein
MHGQQNIKFNVTLFVYCNQQPDKTGFILSELKTLHILSQQQTATPYFYPYVITKYAKVN